MRGFSGREEFTVSTSTRFITVTTIDPVATTKVNQMDESATLSIGQLARATGTKVETIRFYEKSGLLPAPARTEGNYRTYTSAHLGRVSFIRRARDLGFSLDQVRELLELADDRTQPCGAIDAIASAHRAEIERKILGLQALKAELDSLIDQCSCSTIAECRIVESLSPAG